MTLKPIEDEMWVGTDGRGVFRISNTKVQRFTFDGTAGGLRSDHVYAIFADREGVIWFGTDRGVCRYDPHAPRVESVGDNSDTNFIRSLYQASSGRTIAGTNRGLFVYDEETSIWNPVPALGRNIIYAIAEDKSQRLLVASASGFYVAPRQSVPLEEQVFTRVEDEFWRRRCRGQRARNHAISWRNVFRDLWSWHRSHRRQQDQFDLAQHDRNCSRSYQSSRRRRTTTLDRHGKRRCFFVRRKNHH